MPRTSPKRKSPSPSDGRVRLQRLMADAGVASRRACEAMIEGGRVSVNGEFVTRLPVLVDPDRDVVEVDGQRLGLADAARHKGSARHVYVMFYKPRHTITTMDDPDGRRTVAELVQHPSGVRLYPVGRLDIDTMGLLLLTNDGDFANALTHPRYGVHKTYRAIVKGQLGSDRVEALSKGLYLADRRDGETVGASRTAGVDVKVVRTDMTRTIIDITLAEGRNRQVRRMLASVGCPVRKLVRIAMGPVVLKGLRLGEWRELTGAEVLALRKAARGKGPKGLEYTPSAGATAMRLGNPRDQSVDENDDIDMPIEPREEREPREPRGRDEKPARLASPSRRDENDDDQPPRVRPNRPEPPARRDEEQKPARVGHPLVMRVGETTDGPIRRLSRQDVGLPAKQDSRPGRGSTPSSSRSPGPSRRNAKPERDARPSRAPAPTPAPTPAPRGSSSRGPAPRPPASRPSTPRSSTPRRKGRA